MNQQDEVPPNPWKTLESRLIYENHWLRLREDRVIRPDGNPGIYGVVEFRPAVGIVAMNSRDEVILTGQWRYTRGEFRWEIPVGASEEGETDLLAAAKRELEEEAGIVAHNWRYLGVVDGVVGATTESAHFYLARNLSETEMRHDAEEAIVTRWLPFNRVLQMVLNGEITESITVSAIQRVALLGILTE